jgi:uncharacterized protein (TIGR03083 family)
VGIGVEVPNARRAIESNAMRAAASLGSEGAGSQSVPGLKWSLAELAAHVVSVVQWFEDYVTGRQQPPVAPAELPQFNDQRIDAIETRDLGELAGLLEASAASYLEATADLPGDRPVPWYGGHTIDLATTHGIVTSELVVHGFDIARAVGAAWTIDRGDAIVAVLGGMGVLPTLVDPEAAAGVTGGVEIRLRKGPRWRILLSDGALRIAPVDEGSVECYVSADPPAYLLLGFQRVPQWRPIVTGRVLTWGRRPWLAAQLPRLLIPV